MQCPNFLAAFQKAYNLNPEQEITSLEYHSILELNVTSGNIIACDP